MNKYHFIGIGGISMSALAMLLKLEGHYVQGSDISCGNICENLKNNGIKVFEGHNRNNVGDCNIVVYSAAITENEELIEAKKRNLKIISRAQLLGQIAKNYKNVISVSGAHGKTTTTAMLFSCFLTAKKQPTLHLGGIYGNSVFGFANGKQDFFITEACEYKNSFLELKSNIGVILNIENEHLDFFKTHENILNAFEIFANNSDNVVINSDCDLTFKSQYITYGTENSNYLAKNIVNNCGRYSFDCYFNNKFLYTFEIGAIGEHNVYNALAVIAVCRMYNLCLQDIFMGLKNFSGVKRRFEFLGNTEKNINIVHDYAHHPTEIKKSIIAAKNFLNNKKLLVVFQPHTYSRTEAFMEDFVNVFKETDNLMIIKSYAAREKFNKNGSSFTLYKKIKRINSKVTYKADFGKTAKILQNYAENGYFILILGAGNVDILAEKLSKLC